MEKKKITLSVALAVRNEEKNLASCLVAVRDIADEIVIVDGSSTDKTVIIAKNFHANVIRAENESMFHINKQKALEACNGVWILQLDADEIVTKELKEEITSVLGLRSSEIHNDIYKNPRPTTHDLRPTINGYFIPRRNYFWGHFMKKGGQYPDFVIRLVRNGKARFPCVSVHEQIEIDGEVGYMKHPLLHYSYRTKEEYWKKATAYISLTAEEFRKTHLPKNVVSWFRYTIQKPVYTFFSLFIRHKGFVDGIYGFVFAYWSALHFPLAYRKYVKQV